MSVYLAAVVLVSALPLLTSDPMTGILALPATLPSSLILFMAAHQLGYFQPGRAEPLSELMFFMIVGLSAVANVGAASALAKISRGRSKKLLLHERNDGERGPDEHVTTPRVLQGGHAVEGVGRVNRTGENVFWLLALLYVVIIMLTLIKTAPGFGHHGLAAMPALTLTLPTSLVLMVIAPKSIGLGGFISIAAVGALVNVGFTYLILFGLDHGEKGDR